MAYYDSDDATDGQFTPFNDTDQPRIEQLVLRSQVASGGMDTRAIDPFRQGVSVITPLHRYGTLQPKMGSGSPRHYTSVQVIGQPRDFTQVDETKTFIDIPKWNAAVYIADTGAYPLPLRFNGGPQDDEIAKIDPLGVTAEQGDTTHGAKGYFSDGNESVLGRGVNRVEQFVEYSYQPLAVFLDEGTEYLGDSANDDEKIVIDGYLDTDFYYIEPFDESHLEAVVNQAQIVTGSQMETEMLKLKYNLNQDIRGSVTRRSATAGTYVYGANAGRCGTDSIAFSNLQSDYDYVP